MFRLRNVLLIGALLIAIVAAAAVLWTRSGADRTTKVDVAKIAREHRTTRRGQEAGLRPEPGTYRYHVEGFDRVSALGGSKHEFGPEMAAVVELGDGCEWTMEFIYAKERRVKTTYCTDSDGTRMVETTNTVEFFNVNQADRQQCGATAWLTKAGAKVGSTQSYTCANDDRAAAHVATLLDPVDAPRVAGLDVEKLVLVQDKLTMSGETKGSTTDRTWYLRSGLPVAFTEKSLTRSKSVLGDTDYEIDTSVRLLSATPE